MLGWNFRHPRPVRILIQDLNLQVIAYFSSSPALHQLSRPTLSPTPGAERAGQGRIRKARQPAGPFGTVDSGAFGSDAVAREDEVIQEGDESKEDR